MSVIQTIVFLFCANDIPLSIIFNSSQPKVFIRYPLKVCFIIYERDLLLSRCTLNIDLRGVFSLKCITHQIVHLFTNRTDYPLYFCENKMCSGANLKYWPSVFSMVSSCECNAINLWTLKESSLRSVSYCIIKVIAGTSFICNFRMSCVSFLLIIRCHLCNACIKLSGC